MLSLALLLCAARASAEPILIGDLETFHHDVRGELWALNDKTLMVKNFNYDGTGPDAFFWVGVTGSPSSTDESSTAILAHPFKGEHFTYRDEAAPVLTAAAGEDVTLILPEGRTVSDLKWFSVWCRKFTIDFGNILFDGSALETTDLPSPLAPPKDNSVEEARAEPEPEPELESGYEHDHEYDHEYEHGENSVGKPEPEPILGKGEPEPEPASSTSLASSLLSLLLTLTVVGAL